MNSLLRLKLIVAALSIAVLSACAPPVVRMAPPPTAQQLALNRQVQLRVIPVPMESVFPRVLDVLMDNGFIVRSVNEKAGFVSFYQQWNDVSQRYADLKLEGALLFKPVDANSTQARAVLTGDWQTFSAGGSDSASSMVSGVQQSIGAREYERVLDAIEHGLAPGK